MRPLKPAQDRPDPAPSRLAYRVQRLWLTPLFRALVRTGLPVFAVIGLGGWYAATSDPTDGIKTALFELRTNIENRPEFRVNLMRIENASEELATDVREVTALDFPVSSFDLDLDGLRRRIGELDAVERADLVIRKGGVLTVSVVERTPAFVWRGRDLLELIDAEGHRVAAIETRQARADLPLLLGAGADRATGEARALLAAAGPIRGRLRGLVRVGERRWDLVLEGGLRILLPETGAVGALDRLLAFDGATDLLARDIALVDLRFPERPVLRINPGALARMRDAAVPPASAEDGAL